MDDSIQPVLWMAICKVCQQELPFESFYWSEKLGKISKTCKACQAERDAERRKKQRALKKQKAEQYIEYIDYMEYKQCDTCRQKKIITDFPFNDNGVRGLRCKLCVKDRERIQRQIRREKRELERIEATLSITWKERIKQKERKQYNSHLQQYFGKTIEEYESMVRDQQGKCAICGILVDNIDERLVVDHSHVTGVVRGLLCFRCNVGLGWFRDSIDSLQNAIKYLHHYDTWNDAQNP